MLVQIGVKAPDFHDPLGVWVANLLRTQSQLRALAFAGSTMAEPVVDAEAQEQALSGVADALSFFSSGNDPLADAQETVLPRLLPHLRPMDPILETLDELAEDAEECRSFQLVALRLARRLLSGESSTWEMYELHRIASLLLEIYDRLQRQIVEQVIPCAHNVLEPEELEDMGREMARRSGVESPLWSELNGQPAAPGLP